MSGARSWPLHSARHTHAAVAGASAPAPPPSLQRASAAKRAPNHTPIVPRAQVRIVRERGTGKVMAMKKLRKAEMLRRGQARGSLDCVVGKGSGGAGWMPVGWGGGRSCRGGDAYVESGIASLCCSRLGEAAGGQPWQQLGCPHILVASTRKRTRTHAHARPRARTHAHTHTHAPHAALPGGARQGGAQRPGRGAQPIRGQALLLIPGGGGFCQLQGGGQG